MHGLAWSELNYCAWFVLSVSSLPLSVMLHSCHACVNLSRLRSLGFTPMLHSGSSPSPTQQRAGISHAQNFPRTFGLHEIFKCAYLNFAVYGRNIHTTFANAVMLVWGSPQLKVGEGGGLITLSMLLLMVVLLPWKNVVWQLQFSLACHFGRLVSFKTLNFSLLMCMTSESYFNSSYLADLTPIEACWEVCLWQLLFKPIRKSNCYDK